MRGLREHRGEAPYASWMRAAKKFPLYFYEVEMGQQMQDFWPTHYLDITEVVWSGNLICLNPCSFVAAEV